MTCVSLPPKLSERVVALTGCMQEKVATRERCHDLVIRSREHKTDTVTGSYGVLNY